MAPATSTRPARLPSSEEVESWIGRRVDDINGTMVGEVERVCHDDSGAPAWLVVTEFHLEDGRRFVIPAADSVSCSGRVWCTHPRERIRTTARIAGAVAVPQGNPELLALYGAKRPSRLS
jgi:hypothetical protein